MGNEKLQDFESLFRTYFEPLCGFAAKYIHDFDESKNLVHDVFIAVWEKFDALPADTHYRSYLYTAVRNKSLNYLRDKRNIISFEPETTDITSSDNPNIEAKELEKEIEYAINMLPEKCRIVFEMSRFEELKYAEIAAKLDISVKTVEGRMTQALSLLRDSLKEYIMAVFLILAFQGLVNYLVL